jgi:hypothetical protein
MGFVLGLLVTMIAVIASAVVCGWVALTWDRDWVLETWPRCTRCGEMREWRHKCRDAYESAPPASVPFPCGCARWYVLRPGWHLSGEPVEGMYVEWHASTCTRKLSRS